MATKVAIVGAGSVGSTLGARLLLHPAKFAVKYAARDPSSDKVKAVLAAQPQASADLVKPSIAWADAVILATGGEHTDAGTKKLADSFLPEIKGKVLIDVTNPLTAYPGLEVRWDGTSAGEKFQEFLPDTFVYKAFNTVGVEHMQAPDGAGISGQRLTMLFAGSKDKQAVAQAIVEGVGFEPVYVGPIRYARNLEAIAELWIHLGVPPVHKGGGVAKYGRNFHLQLIHKP